MNPSKGDGRYDRRSHRRQRAASTPPHHPYARPQQNVRPSNAPMPPLSQILYGRGLPRGRGGGAGSSYTRGQGTSSHTTGQPTLSYSTTVHVPPDEPSSRRYIERENLNSRDQLYAELQPALVQHIDKLASAVTQLQLQNRRPDNIYADQRQDYNALSAADWAREARRQQGLPDANIDPRRPDALLAVHTQAHRAIHPTVGPGETIARTPAWYEQQGRRSDEIQVIANERRPWYLAVPPEYWTDPGALCVYCGGAVWGQDLDFDTRQCGHYQHRGCPGRYNGVGCQACAAGTRVFPFEF